MVELIAAGHRVTVVDNLCNSSVASLRAVEGILVSPTQFGLPLGDGVQTKVEGFNNSFPYVMPANSGRESDHIGPGQAGCTGLTGGICPE